MPEETFKQGLIQQANIQPGMKILDLGCGTLTLMLKRAYPEAQVTGLDGDPQVLDIAREKSRSINIQWDEGLASSLPYPDSVFDRMVSSLVIHHLVIDDKRRAFKEIIAYSNRVANYTLWISARHLLLLCISYQDISVSKRSLTTSMG